MERLWLATVKQVGDLVGAILPLVHKDARQGLVLIEMTCTLGEVLGGGGGGHFHFPLAPIVGVIHQQAEPFVAMCLRCLRSDLVEILESVAFQVSVAPKPRCQGEQTRCQLKIKI